MEAAEFGMSPADCAGLADHRLLCRQFRDTADYGDLDDGYDRFAPLVDAIAACIDDASVGIERNRSPPAATARRQGCRRPVDPA